MGMRKVHRKTWARLFKEALFLLVLPAAKLKVAPSVKTWKCGLFILKEQYSLLKTNKDPVIYNNTKPSQSVKTVGSRPA